MGDTAAAVDSLGDIWTGISSKPRLEGSRREQAETLLASGMLTSKLGVEQKISGAQESAKDLLNEALRLFARLKDPRQHKAQIELSLCYWRAGEMTEAFAYVNNIHTSDPRLQFEAALAKALIETEAAKLDAALETLQSVESLAESMPAVLQGQFHQERAVILRNLETPDSLDRALIEYEAALVFYEESGSKKGEAMVVNNLGSIYRDYGDYPRAHHYATRAVKLFTRLGSQHLIAEARDQQATIYFAEGNYAEALRYARMATSLLEECDQKALLARALLTTGRSLVKVRKIDEAKEEFERAAAIFEHTNDRVGEARVYLTMLEDLSLSADEAFDLLTRAASLTAATHLTERYQTVAAHVGQLLICRNSRTFADLDQHLKVMKGLLIERAIQNAGGLDAPGVIVRAAEELGITHTGLSYLLSTPDYKDIGYKRRPRKQSIITIPKTPDPKARVVKKST